MYRACTKASNAGSGGISYGRKHGVQNHNTNTNPLSPLHNGSLDEYLNSTKDGGRSNDTHLTSPSLKSPNPFNLENNQTVTRGTRSSGVNSVLNHNYSTSVWIDDGRLYYGQKW